MTRLTRWLPSSAMIPLALVAASGLNAQDSWMRLVGSEQTTILANDTSVVLPFAVELDDSVAVADVRIRLTSARLGARFEEGVSKAFEVDSLVSRDGLGPALVVRMNLDIAHWQGTYDLRVEARKRSGDKVSLDLGITHPAAQLSVQPAKLVIDLVRFIPWATGTATTSRFEVIHSGRDSRIEPMTVQARVPLSDGANRGIDGRVMLARTGGVLRPNDASEVTYTLEGHFPLGTATGTARIAAPQLAEPTVVPVEVHTRGNRLWIPILVLFGTAAGYFLRKTLTSRIELRTAQVEASRRMGPMEAFLTTYGPEGFRPLNDALKALRTVRAGRAAAAINDAVTAAEGKYNEAVAALAGRRTAARNALKSLVAPMNPGGYPSEMEARVTALAPDLSRAATLLADDRIKETEAALGQLKGSLHGLRGASASWTDLVSTQLAPLENADAGLPHSVSTKVQTLVEEIQAAVAAVDFPGSGELEPLLTAMTGVREVRFDLERLVHRLFLAFDSFDKALREALADRSGVPEDRYEDVRTAITQVKVGLGSRRDAPVEALQELLGDSLPAFRGALRDALAEEGDPLPDDVQARLDERKYVEAVRRLPDVAIPPVYLLGDDVAGARGFDDEDFEEDDTSGLDGFDSPGTSRSRARVSVPRWTFGSRSTGGAVIEINHSAGPRPLTLAEAEADLKQARAIQFWAVTVVIALLGTALFAPGFVGTWSEVGKILAWAFSLDVAADTVFEKLSAYGSST